jgi:uncharacterized protein (DUF1499 family)
MTPLGWLLGLVLPACGSAGAQGLPLPPAIDPAHIERLATPNSALAAPAGFQPPPDIETRRYPIAADRLYDAIRAVAEHQPRTYVAAIYPDRRQAHYVVRSAMFNFPDLVAVVAMEDGTETSTLLLFSRSVYGRSDLGVNRGRLIAWLAALDQRLAVPVSN